MKVNPPHIALRILRWFCRTDRIEEVEGDLQELYEVRYSGSAWKARWRYSLDVLNAFNSTNIRRPMWTLGNQSLFQNYLKIGARNFARDIRYSILNLLGLSLGLAVFLIMLMLVNYELSFDRFHIKGDNVFEVVQVFQNADGNDPEIWTSLNLSSAIRQEMTIVENAVTVHGAASTWITANEKREFEEDGIVAGPQFFEIFDFPIIDGDKSRVLSESHSIIIDETMALKYFDNASPIGETISLERYGEFTVTGVMATVPPNSFIQFNYIISQDYEVFYNYVAPWFPQFFNSWQGAVAATFVQLKNKEDNAIFNERLQPILAKYQVDNEAINDYFLINLYDLHFNSNGIDGSVNHYLKGDKSKVKLFGFVAFVILMMAAINYVNLTTARSLRRIKEVGVRKSMGGFRRQIIAQYFTETFLQVILAAVLSLLWVFLFIPYFISITGINIELTNDVLLQIIPAITITLALVTVFSGAYPAFYLSNFSPVRIFSKMTLGSGDSKLLRNTLMVIQYSLVIIILSSFIIINKQYSYILNKDLGFDTEQLVAIEINGTGVRNNYHIIKQELLSHPEIINVTGLTRMISGYRSSASVFAEKSETQQNKLPMRFYGMDVDGLETLNMSLVSGNNFLGKPSLDSVSIFLNEKAAELYGGNTTVIGTQIDLYDDSNSDELLYSATVIGVIEDFNFSSLREPIGPAVIGYYKNSVQSLDDIIVKLDKNNMLAGLEIIESIHNKYDENGIITMEFVDDMVQRSYEQELLYRNIFVGASTISMVIALLGIIGLISYNLRARQKEFGIRKVLGANYIQIFSLQGKLFARFIIISILVAIPLVWISSNLWLSNYAFRIEPSIWPFLLTTFIIIGSTLILLLGIAHKTLRRNPLEELRYE